MAEVVVGTLALPVGNMLAVVDIKEYLKYRPL